MTNKTLMLLLFSMVLALNLHAQPVPDSEESWDKLRNLDTGKKILIHLKTGGDINGKFLRVEPQLLFVMSKKEEIRLKKENIKLVVCGKTFSGKKAFLGAAIGFAVGTAFGTYMASAMDEGYGDTGDHLATGAAFGMLGSTAGIVISGIGSSGGELILYSSPREIRIRTRPRLP